MIITLEHYFLWFLFYSFVGWMYESILVSCQQHLSLIHISEPTRH